MKDENELEKLRDSGYANLVYDSYDPEDKEMICVKF